MRWSFRSWHKDTQGPIAWRETSLPRSSPCHRSLCFPTYTARGDSWRGTVTTLPKQPSVLSVKQRDAKGRRPQDSLSVRLVDVCTPILFQVFPALFEPSIDFIMAVMDQSAARRLQLLRSRRATSPCFRSSNRCFGVRKERMRSIRSKTWTARGAGHCVKCYRKRSSSQGHSWSDRVLWCMVEIRRCSKRSSLRNIATSKR